jgi:aminoglycoside phosphotransferase family enzyme
MSNEQFDFENKAMAVVDSCVSQQQLDSAQKYVELYFAKTGDINAFRSLIDAINTKHSDLA